VVKGQGRLEERPLEAMTWLEESLGADWPGCRQVFRHAGAPNIAAALRRGAARVRDLLVSLRILKD
jgi:hypothetical protein